MNISNKIKAPLARIRSGIAPLVRRPRYGPKVFCIGYNKTGTTSVGKALQMLGYDHSSFNRTVWRRYYRNGNIKKVLDYTARYESFDDLPWLKEDMIPILDETFADSKFVYLERDEASWKDSYARWTRYVSGIDPEVASAWSEYQNHRTFVLQYFAVRPADKFIVLDVRDPLGFAKLAAFLGKRSMQNAFPHYNKTPR